MANNFETERAARDKEWYQNWTIDVNRFQQQESELIGEGLKLFFARVLNLPLKQESKNTDAYEEADLNLVTITADDLRKLNRDQIDSLRVIQDATGFWVPFKIGVFGIEDNKRESHKGIINRSANVVIKSGYGDTFVNQKVIHLWHEYYQDTKPGYEGEIVIQETNFGRVPENLSKLHLLQAANTLVDIYSIKLAQVNDANNSSQGGSTGLGGGGGNW